jgi:membrane protein YqaA with SNARE-associated domain
MGKNNFFKTAVLAGMLLITVFFLLLFIPDLKGFLLFFSTEYGLIGLFVASIIANATILFPLPMDAVVMAAAAFSEDPVFFLLIILVSGFGAALGELTSYFLGLIGVRAVERLSKKEFNSLEAIKNKVKNKGMIFIFLGAFTPFPFDLIGIASGIIKYDLKKFFIATFAGKLFRYFLLAVAALYGIEAIKEFLLA